MQVSLEAIKFNHDSTFKKTGAFNLRQNETNEVLVPEWRLHDTSTHKFSPAAYVTRTVPTPVTIMASFTCDDLSVTKVNVQALSAAYSGVNVLGDIPTHEVEFNNGRSGFVTLKLTNATLPDAAIGKHDLNLRWQFCENSKNCNDSNNWADFQETKHRIYSVPALPTKPWEPRPAPLQCLDLSNIHIPWTEVLDYACSWAAGEDDLDEAAKRVTVEVYNLGKKLVKYAGGPSYAFFDNFRCTEFLKLLKTGVGGSQTVNCDDCATVVSTFANILGCDLNQSGMGESFPTNRILPIGAAVSDWITDSFIHHSVAWKGDCLENDSLFDACFQVDNDGTPETTPEVAFQPANVKFGEFGDKAYKFCFVKDGAPCRPIPHSEPYGRKRRPLGKGFLADKAIAEEGLINTLKQIYEFDTWPPVESPDMGEDQKGYSLANLFEMGTMFPGWKLHQFEHLENERFENVFLMLFLRPGTEVRELLAVNVYECRQVTDPNNLLLTVLGSFEQLSITRLTDPSIGNISFQEAGGVAVMFRRGRFVAVVRSAGRQSLSVIAFASLLDHILILNEFRKGTVQRVNDT